MMISVMSDERDTLTKLAEKSRNKWLKINKPIDPNWQNQLDIKFIGFTYEQIMGKYFSLFAHFEIIKIYKESNNNGK